MGLLIGLGQQLGNIPCQEDVAGLSCSPPVQGAKWRYRERAGEKIKREGEKKRKGGRMERHIEPSVYVEVPGNF